MTVWLQAARKALCQTDNTDETQPKSEAMPNKTCNAGVLSVSSARQFKVDSHSAAADPAHAFSITGYPLTWTGRIVSLDEWRRLSAWERHGPDGRVFCGICRNWVERGGDCPSPGCWKEETYEQEGRTGRDQR